MGKRDYNPALNLPCFYFRLSSQRVYCAHCLLTLFFAMPQIIVFDTDGVEQRHDYQVGDTLMEVLREADYDEIQALFVLALLVMCMLLHKHGCQHQKKTKLYCWS